jgi:hypothetical protein
MQAKRFRYTILGYTLLTPKALHACWDVARPAADGVPTFTSARSHSSPHADKHAAKGTATALPIINAPNRRRKCRLAAREGRIRLGGLVVSTVGYERPMIKLAAGREEGVLQAGLDSIDEEVSKRP